MRRGMANLEENWGIVIDFRWVDNFFVGRMHSRGYQIVDVGQNARYIREVGNRILLGMYVLTSNSGDWANVFSKLWKKGRYVRPKKAS